MRAPGVIAAVFVSTFATVARAEGSKTIDAATTRRDAVVVVRVDGARQVAFIGDQSCVAPCSLAVRAGTYRVGVGKTTQDDVPVLASGILRAPHGGSRSAILAGAVVTGVGVLGSLAALFWATFPFDTPGEAQTALTLTAVGGAVAVVGLVTLIVGFVGLASSPRHIVLRSKGVSFTF